MDVDILRMAFLSGSLTFCATCGHEVKCPPPGDPLPLHATFLGTDYTDYTTYRDWGEIVYYHADVNGLELQLYIQYLDGHEYEEYAPLHEVELTFMRQPPLEGRTRPPEDTGEESDSGAEAGKSHTEASE